MAQETIDFGSYPNDPDSDAIRVAFQKTQNNFNELFSIQYQTGVSQILEGSGISVNLNTGNVTVTNRIANITIQTDANFKIGVTTATSNTATINSGTTPFVLNLANAITTGNITATGSIRGVIATASNSQPNITSVGNLTNLSVVGNVTSNNFIGSVCNVTTINATTINSPGSTGQVLFNLLGNVSASTNLTFTGTLLSVIGEISATGNVQAGNIRTGGLISATGNANVGNIGTSGLITATGNITGGNLIGRYANGTSNINIPTANGNINLSVAGVSNVIVVTSTGANINGYANVTGNANVGNLGTGGLIVATGNITGGNLGTGGLITATGNITGGNLITNGVANVTGNANVGNLGTGGLITATGNVQAGNIKTGGLISALGNLTSGNANLGNLAVANFFQGNGSLLTGIQATNVIGNVGTTTVSYQSNIIPTNTNLNITNYVTFVNTTSGTANITADANLTYNPNTRVLTSGNLSITGNIVAGNINVQTGTLTGRNLSTGANTTQGNITGNWVLTTGSLLSATYADLAEYYAADKELEPGTVVEFGGTAEIRQCDTEMSSRVAGIVSTNPAYVMNSMIEAEYPVAVALQGRVPVKVIGLITKGDMLVSAGNGFAKSNSTPIIGSVLGKALEDFSGVEGVIEIAVGRL